MRYPDIELEISVSDSTIDLIKEGIDIGIRFGDLIEEGMVAKPLTPPAPDALFASPEYIKEFGEPKTPEQLENHKLIQYRFGASNQLAPLILNKDGNSIRVEMRSAVIVNDTDLCVDAALAGLGIGRIISNLVNDHLESGSLMPILRPYWNEISGLYIYFSQNSQKAKRVRVLIDFLLEKINKSEELPNTTNL